MEKIIKPMSEVMEEEQTSFLSKNDKKRIASDLAQALSATTCLLVSLFYQWFFPGQVTVADFIRLLGVVIVGLPILITGVKGFLQKEFSSAMETLVSIAMILSVLNGQTVVSILIPLLLTLVHFIEERSLITRKDALDGLRKIQTKWALKVVKDGVEKVNTEDLKIGDLILVKPGMALPVDGVITNGTSAINQQSLTGEALPREVSVSDNVYAGTINISGEITVKVEKLFKDTSFQKIVSLLEESQKGTTTESKLVDSFLKYYIPLSLIIATVVWFFSRDINRAVAILVVSCPCGHMLVNSAPMITVLSVASKRGILIRNISFIEKLSKVDKVFFDKTGTLTTGNIRVKDCLSLSQLSEEEILYYAKSVAMHSHHPLSQSIAELDCKASEEFEIKEEKGLGLTGTDGKDTVLLGSKRWMEKQGLKIDHTDEESGSYVALNNEVIGVIHFEDTIKENALETVDLLHKAKVEEIGMLTGDKKAMAEKIKTQCGLDKVYSELLPEEKRALIANEAKENCVVFVGDGINDVPALDAADIGIAMGSIGADAAIESADITLMNDNLENIPFVLKLAKFANLVIRENIILVFCTSAVMIFLTASGILSVLPGVILHNIGAFFVVLNSARLRNIQELFLDEKIQEPTEKEEKPEGEQNQD